MSRDEITEKIIGCAYTIANEVLVELKAIKNIEDIHVAQCLNYLKATGCIICLLINFGNPRVEIKRIINNK
jgi:GxxExxY protein